MNDHCELAYWLSPKQEGKGIMSASTKRIFEFGFNELKMNRIEAYISEQNNKCRKDIIG